MSVTALRPGVSAPPRSTVLDAAAFGLAVVVVLVFSQGWVAPLLGTGTPDAATSALIRNLFFPAYAAALALMAMRLPGVLQAVLRSPLLVLLIGCAALSFTWSVAPDQTLRRVVALGFTTLSGVVLAARFRWSGLAEVLATASAILAVISLAVGLALPEVGRMPELFPGAWRGVWSEKNAFGSNMAIAAVTFVAAGVLKPNRRLLWFGMAGLASLLVLTSTSKTSLMCLLLGFCAAVFVALVRRGPVVGTAVTWAGVAGCGLVGLGLVFAADAFFELLGKDSTLTGRTEIWEAAMRQIALKPWTGFGYGAVWENKDDWGPLNRITQDAGFVAQHAHNTWIEVWIGFGLVGLLIWSALFAEVWIRTLVSVFRDPEGRGAAWLAFPFACVFTLLTLTESVAVTYNDLRWLIFVAIAVKLAAPRAADRS